MNHNSMFSLRRAFLATLVVLVALAGPTEAMSQNETGAQEGGGNGPALARGEIEAMNLSGKPFAILTIDPATGKVLYPGAGGGAEGPLEVDSNEGFDEAGEFYWDDEVDCVYFEHPTGGQPWSRGCANATEIVVLHVSTVNGRILRLLPPGRIEGVANPDLESTDDWGWAANSPGCVYYSFQGRLLKICD